MFNHPIIPYRKQQGAALFLALIALVALTLAGIAMIRSVDTGNLVAGNLAFKEAATHEADVGRELALTYINNLNNRVISRPNIYFSTMRTTQTGTLTAAGLPVVLDLSGSSPATQCTSAGYGNSKNVGFSFNANSGNCVLYVVERLCTSSTNCLELNNQQPGGTTGEQNLYAALGIYYRVSIRVDGPRNTTVYVQDIFLI